MLSFLLCTLAITATASPLTRPDIFIDADDLFAALPLSGYGLAAPQPLIQAAHHEYTFCAEWGGRCPRPNSRFGYIRTYENFKKCDSGVEGFGGIFSSCSMSQPRAIQHFSTLYHTFCSSD